MRSERVCPARDLLSFLSLTFALVLAFSTVAHAQSPYNTTGRWTQLSDQGANWGHRPIHVALLRGDANYHSYVMSWHFNRVGTSECGGEWCGGLWGWNPPTSEDGAAYPALTFEKIDDPEPAAPGVDIFCSGHSLLADGKLFVAGAHEEIGAEAEVNGVKQSIVYDPQTRVWTPNDEMALRRYYPTNTTLPDGRVLVTGGYQYYHMLTFGGRTTPTSPASARNEIQRLGILESSHWDAAIAPGGGVQWPDARANHTAVGTRESVADQRKMIIFGGEGTVVGQVRNDTWQLTRSRWDDDEERYDWQRIANDGSAPFRTRHGVVFAINNSMYLYGGTDEFSMARDQVWEMYQDVSGWHWRLKTTSGSGTDLPGPRFGHTVAYEEGRNRMIVFGGLAASGFADNNVYALDLSTLAWKQLTLGPRSVSPPAAREGHTCLVDPVKRNRNLSTPAPDWSRMILYAGKTESNPNGNGEVWMLWIHPTDPNVVEWQQVNPDPDPLGTPAGRSGHSVVWQQSGSSRRMMIFGGDTGASGSDATAWVTDLTWYNGNEAAFDPKWVAQPNATGVALSGHTAVRDVIPLLALEPELFDPTQPAGSRWSTLTSAPKRYDYYPFMFVLPSGNVLMAGPKFDTWVLKLNASPPIWQESAYPHIWHGSAVMYRPGKIMKARLDDPYVPGDIDTDRIDLSSSDTGNWIGSTGFEDRRDHNLTLLPDGRVLATGGIKEDTVTPRPGPQIWDPTANNGAGSWTPYGELQDEPTTRRHHSAATLLPDGRVLSGSEGPSPDVRTIYSPPYLFTSSSPAPRPAILGAPDTVGYGKSFTICTNQVSSIATASLVKPSATTHEFDQDQRYVPLTIRDRCAGQLIVDGPANGNIAPPGDYMLFVVDNGVPAVAKWVRVAAQGGLDTCDGVAPAVVSGLTISDVGYKSATLTWSSPGDDANCGEAQVTEVRMSTSAITEANWTSPSTSLEATLIPGPNGTPHCLEVDWSGAGCSRHFAFRTRDDGYRWSAITNIFVPGDCSAFEIPVCDGGGLLAGGGGGGGGGEESARQLSLATTGSVSGLTGDEESGENSVLWPGAGSEVADLHRLAGSPEESNGQYTVRFRQAGSWRAAIDQLSLGVVDHDPAITAIAGRDRVLLGTLEPVTSVSDAIGGEVARLQGETADPPYSGRTGQHVLVRLRGASASTALVIESQGAAARAGDEPGGILVQKPGADGNWVTIAEVHPRRKLDRCAVATGGSESVRLVFLRDCALRSLARLNVAETVVPQPLELAGADHSSPGGVGEAIRESGGSSTSLVPGETLSLQFTPIERDPERVRDFFLSARGSFELARDQGSTELSGAASAPAAWVFGIGPARPNPSFGTATIDYTLAHKVQVQLLVYDVAGRLVRTLVKQELPAGPQSAAWDGRDDRGQRVGGGVYLYRLVAGDWHSERKLIVLQR
jgi:hypothetical protein